MLFEPLHNTQPDGIALDAPDQMIIPPEGTAYVVGPAGPVGPLEPVAPWRP